VELLCNPVEIRHRFQVAVLHGSPRIGIVKERFDYLLSRR
jgi:hypothetical protein